MGQRVVVIGHGYLSRLALIRALGSVGCEVSVIVTMYGKLSTKKPLDCYSKYVRDVYYCNAKDEHDLIGILLTQCKSKDNKTIIIPDSDFSAAFIDKNKYLLSDFFLFPHVNDSSLSVEFWMDKERQKKLAKSIGLTVANMKQIHTCDGVEPDLSDITYPCFTKALSTIGGGKQCFRRCASEDALKNALCDFSHSGFNDILVEDFVDIEKEFAVVGLSDGQTVLIPGVIQFVENCKSHLGIARKGKIVPSAGFDSLIDQFKLYVKSTKFIGLFDIDFLYSKGKYYFCEMNFRFGGSGNAYIQSGINLPALLVEVITEKSLLDNYLDRISSVKVFVNERMFVDDLRHRYITIKKFNRDIQSADIRFIHNELDPCPEQRFRYVVMKAKVMYLLRDLLKGS